MIPSEGLPTLFNSPMETGVRSVIILDATAPRAFDLTQMTWLDHLVVHTGDIGGPMSLHPDIPQRAGELVVRRQLVLAGLKMMQGLHMVDVGLSTAGILYRASEETGPFVQLVRTAYGQALKEHARWLADYLAKIDADGLAKLIREKIGRWTIEFQQAGSQQV